MQSSSTTVISQTVKHARSKNKTHAVRDRLLKKSQCPKSLKDSFKSLDQFGQSVQLTVDGESTYKSLPGAILSCGLMGLTLAYFIYRLYYMANYDNPILGKVTSIRSGSADGPF